MKASIVRGLLLSSVTVFGSTLPTPGTSSSGERSRSASYIGCGNVGPVISDWSVGATGAPALVTRA